MFINFVEHFAEHCVISFSEACAEALREAFIGAAYTIESRMDAFFVILDTPKVCRRGLGLGLGLGFGWIRLDLLSQFILYPN